MFSLGGEPPRALGQDSGAPTQFDSACLVGDSTRYPCFIQKLSAAGATLRLDANLSEDEPLCLELANGQHFHGRIDWSADGEAGFLFDEPIDVIGALARNLASLPAERRSMPRVETVQTVCIRSGEKVELARTRNISQAGVGLDTRLELDAGDLVQLTFDGLRPLEGSVRWTRDGQTGIEFTEELGWQTLMPWLRNVQRSQAGIVPIPLLIETEGMIPDKHAIRLDAPASVREGVRWWNARVRGLTSHLVELETRAVLSPGAQLWISLPKIGGGPASVVEAAHNRLLCEFRLPLRPSELGLLSGGRAIS